MHDSLWSTTGTEGPNGQIYGTYQYGPFGSTSVASGSPGAGPFLYTGRELDPSGYYFMRNRYYSPGLQRFISSDPASSNGGDTNLYAYVANSPINAVDRLGLSGSAGSYPFGAGWSVLDVPGLPPSAFAAAEMNEGIEAAGGGSGNGGGDLAVGITGPEQIATVQAVMQGNFWGVGEFASVSSVGFAVAGNTGGLSGGNTGPSPRIERPSPPQQPTGFGAFSLCNANLMAFTMPTVAGCAVYLGSCLSGEIWACPAALATCGYEVNGMLVCYGLAYPNSRANALKNEQVPEAP